MIEKIMSLLKKIKLFITQYLFFILLIGYLLFVEYINQYLIINKLISKRYINYSSNVFTLFWIFLILFIILRLLQRHRRKLLAIFVYFIVIFNFIFTISNYFFYRQFFTIISWKDLFLAREGSKFLDALIPYISFKLVIIVACFLILGILIICLIPKKTIEIPYRCKVFGIILGLILLFCAGISHFQLYNSKMELISTWHLYTDSGYYTYWIDPSHSLRVSGTYQYIVRDFYETFLVGDSVKEAKAKVDNIISSYNVTDISTNEYFGIYKDKNLIYVMMESLDDWMVSEEITPTIYKMMQEGINFNSHYSSVYITGSTENTEFIANTGIYPKINGLAPCYAYADNAFPFSIANLFKNKGYEVNSFHEGLGDVYNRENMHISLGYSNYYDYLDMGLTEENRYLDSYIVDSAFDLLTNGSKFMDFIITFSPHQPYDTMNDERSLYVDYVYSVMPNETSKEKVRALSAAHETDLMFKKLIEALDDKGILDDTVIVAFTDHTAKTVGKYDTNANPDETVFFIWNNSGPALQVDRITSTINILPTVINLFGIDSPYYYPGYDALNTSESYYILRDYTYYDGVDYYPLTDKMLDEINYSENVLISNYYGK